ncbi:MAG TPA: hypothetical protein VMR45_05310 [Patescibacteria group bacterium]|nr:hypothetical protein [Patescibacteria group bacterium]
MNNIQVSDRIRRHLAETGQQIDCDYGAMRAMADTVDATPPDPNSILYLIHEQDVRKKQVWQGGYNGGYRTELSPTPVYFQGPNKTEMSVVPDHHAFVVELPTSESDFDTQDISRALALRLLLPQRRRRELITKTSGWLSVASGLAITAMDIASPELGVTSLIGIPTMLGGMALTGWKGPKPHMPDTAKLDPPLFLAGCY